jgi:TRAP-type C4-dicarboxylate transport system permease small subunit
MRRLLDRIYAAALWLAALGLVVIALMVGLQLAGRLIDGLLRLSGLPVYGFVILSLAEIAGYLLACSSFLALAGTLRTGTHVRVTILLTALDERTRRYVELWAFAASALACSYMTYHLANFAWVSLRFNEVSPGVIQVPLAYPQAAMALGALVLTVALIDEFLTVWVKGRPSLRAAEDVIVLGKEG